MRIQATQKLTCFFIAIFAICGLVACNNDSDSKTADKMAPDSSVKAADSTISDTAAMAAKPVKKKRKVSIVFAPAGTDAIAKDKEGVYNRAEVMPEYPGGQNALSVYINDHLDYGQAAIDNNTTGTLRISFVVDEHGKVEDVHLLGDQKVGGGLDEQAVKVVGNMPNWTAGKVKGKNVSTRLELPIAFEVE
jgi:TonB family protein